MAKWGGPSGNLTWPLNPSKKPKAKTKEQTKPNKENKTKKNKPKTKEKQIRRV